MTEDRSFFRSEALQHWADRKGPGNLLRASSRWLDVAFLSVVLLFLGGAALSVIVHTGTFAFGSVAWDEEAGALVARFPEAPAGTIERGAPVEVRAPGGVWIRGFSAEPAGGTLRLRIPPAAALDARALSGGVARVEVGTEPLLVAFVPGARALLGR